MDIARLKKGALVVWLPIFDDIEVQCAHIPQSEYDEISAEAVEIKFDPKSHRRTEVRDDKKFRSLLGRRVVKAWRGKPGKNGEDGGPGFTDGDQPFPCTPENIDYLMEESTEFRLLVMDAPLSLEKMLATEKAATEKNS